MEMQITPAFVLQSGGVTYMGKAKKVPYSEVWARVLGKLRELYPEYDFNRASNSAISLNVAVELGAYEFRAKTTYVVSTIGVPTASIGLPAIDDTGDVVDAIVSGIVGVLECIYPKYFTADVPTTDVFEMVDKIVGTIDKSPTEPRSRSITTKFATWPRRMSDSPYGGGNQGGISD